MRITFILEYRCVQTCSGVTGATGTKKNNQAGKIVVMHLFSAQPRSRREVRTRDDYIWLSNPLQRLLRIICIATYYLLLNSIGCVNLIVTTPNMTLIVVFN